MQTHQETHQEMVKSFMLSLGQIVEDAKVNIEDLSAKDVVEAKLRLTLGVEMLSDMFEGMLTSEQYEDIFEPLFKTLNSAITLLSKENIEIDSLKVLKSLADQEYVSLGTGVWLDLPVEEAFHLVHTNNLTKKDLITGNVTRRPDGKIIKPTGYIPVDLSTLYLKGSQ